MEINHENFSVSIVEHEHWEKKSKGGNYFELVYILEGNGAQLVNGSRHPYTGGAIFLLTSCSSNSYLIRERTRFLFIRFTSSYFSGYEPNSVNYSAWFNRLNFIIGNYDQGAVELIGDPHDKQHVRTLLDMIVAEHYSDNTCSVFLVQNLLVSILVIISRNIEKELLNGQSFSDQRFVKMLHFIHFNLLDQKKVSMEGIASRFGIAETYFSEYFKRNAGEPFRDYILRAKLKIAEARAALTSCSFKEIANELGFTDSSHLNKMMKKYYQKGLKEIRNQAVHSERWVG